MPTPKRRQRFNKLLAAFSFRAMDTPEIGVRYQAVAPDLIADFEQAAWQQAEPVSLDRNWRGERAPNELATTARVLWTDEHLWFGFTCGYTELDVDTEFDVQQERYALWERDVCEAFVQAPLEPNAQAYKEFEVAPTGQWFDVAIRQPRVDVQWDWQSGMKTAAVIDESVRVWRAVTVIPFSAFGVTPQPGDRWRGNLFRISRLQGARQFLAFSPTLTDAPNFHVPERFAVFHFTR